MITMIAQWLAVGVLVLPWLLLIEIFGLARDIPTGKWP